MSQNKVFALKLRAEDETKGPRAQRLCLRGQNGGDSGTDMGVWVSLGSLAQSGSVSCVSPRCLVKPSQGQL